MKVAPSLLFHIGHFSFTFQVFWNTGKMYFYVNCFLLFGQIVFCKVRKNREFHLDFWVGREGRFEAM